MPASELAEGVEALILVGRIRGPRLAVKTFHPKAVRLQGVVAHSLAIEDGVLLPSAPNTAISDDLHLSGGRMRTGTLAKR